MNKTILQIVKNELEDAEYNKIHCHPHTPENVEYWQGKIVAFKFVLWLCENELNPLEYVETRLNLLNVGVL